MLGKYPCVCVCGRPGMELFEEAVRRWEQALTFRSRQAEDEASCSSVRLGAGDAIAEESMEVSPTPALLTTLYSPCTRSHKHTPRHGVAISYVWFGHRTCKCLSTVGQNDSMLRPVMYLSTGMYYD